MLRLRLLQEEWELSAKHEALRQGVAQFEKKVAEDKLEVPFDVITRLYENPEDLSIIQVEFG